jgi:FlaA1/EpsC-like NDP-sugar epimerase
VELDAKNPTLWGESNTLSRTFKMLLDALGWLVATPLAFLIHYDWILPRGSWDAILTAILGLFVLKAGAARAFSLYRRSWSRVAFRDVGDLARAIMGVAVIGSVLLLWLGPVTGIPRSIALLDGLLTLFIMAGMRATARYRHEAQLGQPSSGAQRKAVLVIGAGEAGTLVVREMLRHPEMGLRPVGFLDDDPKKVGYRIATVPVLGTTDDINRLVQRHKVDEVLIALPSSDGRVVREIVGRIEGAKSGLKYRIMPGVYELLSGQVGINRIREVQIEDLLRRPPVELDTAAISNYITDQVVMVTGAGGSIGSELVRQICRFRPKELILFGRGENSIYTLERELERDWPTSPTTA